MHVILGLLIVLLWSIGVGDGQTGLPGFPMTVVGGSRADVGNGSNFHFAGVSVRARKRSLSKGDIHTHPAVSIMKGVANTMGASWHFSLLEKLHIL
jgi:hypothetical protein